MKDKQPQEQPLKEVRTDILSLEKGEINILSSYVEPVIEKAKPIIVDENDLKRVVYISENLSIFQNKVLTKIFIKNKENFAYSLANMPGIDPSFLCYFSNFGEFAKPVKQKRRRYS